MNIGASLVGQLIVLDDDGNPSDDPMDEIDDHAQDVMAELEVLGAIDPSIHTCIEDGVITMTIDIVLEAETRLDAAERASSVIRSAFHAAGVATPDWPFRWDLQEIVFDNDIDLAGV